jgi:hypothetical protein
MKKLFSIFAAACLMAACNSSSSDTSATDSATNMSADTTTMSAPTDTSATSSATMKDGVMTMKDGKMMVMNNGNWEPMTADVTCTNGVTVKTSGEIAKGDRKKTLTEGMMIDKDGQLSDADGKLVDNAGW